MEQKFLSFGFKDEYMHMFGINNIGSIFYVNSREQFAITPKEVIKYERNQILKRFHYHFSIGCCINTYDMVAFITEHGSNLCIFQLKEMSRPLVHNYPLNQTGIFHILYSPRSNCLITVGTGVKVWQLNIEIPQSSILNPKITINLRSEFAYEKYETMILNPPSFDYKRELFFLPTSQGIKGINLNGSQEISMSRLPAERTTPIGYCQSNGKLLTSDPQEGVCLWDKNGKIKHLYTICSSSIISLHFINQEYALVMNCHGAIFILNLKTGRSYHVYTSPMIPTRLILQLDTSEIDPILVLVFNSRAVYKRIIILWSLWAKNVICPKLIRRINKKDEAARLLVQTSNSFVKFFSPKKGLPLTSASPKTSATPVCVLYDRGTFISSVIDEGNSDKRRIKLMETEPRDELFIAMDDNIIYGFDTGFLPCQEVMKVDLKSSFITTCYDQAEDGTFVWMYAVASSRGEAFLCDYNSLRIKCKIMLANYNVLNLFFHDKSGSLVVLFRNEIISINIKKHDVVARLDLNCKEISVSHLDSDFVYIGLATGQIMIVKIIDSFTLELEKDFSSQFIHNEAVSSFAFSQSFWVSAGMDGMIVFWEYSLNCIAKINLPEPIYACEIINGRRDLIVGTKAELMVIKGEVIFNGEVDDEIEVIDNFDKKTDQLYSQIFTLIEEEEEIAESLLDKRKEKAEEEEEKRRKRRKKLDLSWNNIQASLDENEKSKSNVDEALAGMEKLNEGKKVNKKPEDKKIEVDTIDEEEEEDGEDEINEKNGKKKRKKKKKNKNDQEKPEEVKQPSPVQSKEKEDFLNDLFPVKKVPQIPKEPEIAVRQRRTRNENPKKTRASRPDRRAKPDSQVDQKSKEAKPEPIQIKLSAKIDEPEKKPERKEEEEEKEEELVIIDPNFKHRSNKKEVESIDDAKLNQGDIHKEDVATQGEINAEDEVVDKGDDEKSKTVKNLVLKEKQKKEKKKPKTSFAVKKPLLIKESSKPSKSPQKDSLTAKSKKAASSLPNAKQKSNDAQKVNPKVPQNQPKQKLSPRKKVTISSQLTKISTAATEQSTTAKAALKAKEAASAKAADMKIGPKINKGRNRPNTHSNIPDKQKGKLAEIDPLSNLISRKDNSEIEEQLRRRVEANTKLYISNLPQANNPLSVVTNFDDPNWHPEEESKSGTFNYERSCFYDDQNDDYQLNERENANVELDFDYDSDDRLAEAVGKRCPGLIFTSNPKISGSTSTILSISQAIVPGAAWMRRTATGSRLIKSTRPRVLAPVGKIEKSLSIRGSYSESSTAFQTPLQKIRLRGKIGTR